MLKRETLRNAGILFLSAAVSICLAEILVRSFVPVRDVGPVFSVHDPVLGKRIKASFTAERITPEFRMRFTTNSLGFRGPEPDGFRLRPILFLGDSFTLGYGVSDGEEYPARVSAELRRRYGKAAPPVVNAGIGNSGNGFWVKLLQREAEAMQPRLVVMQIFENDFADNLDEKLFALEPGGSLRDLPVPAPGVMRRMEALIQAVPGLSYSHLVGLLREVRAPTFGSQAKSVPEARRQQGLDPSDQLTFRILEEAISICEGRGWKVIGLLVGLSHAHEAAAKELFARRKHPVVLIPAKSERPDLYYKVDGHWHAGGHVFVADRVLEALELETPVGGPQPRGSPLFPI